MPTVPPPAASDPPVIKAVSGADFLALVPHLAGMRPTQSVVCVPFIGRRTAGGAMRINIPKSRRADIRRVVSVAVGAMSRIAGVDRVDVVIYTNATFERERGIPHVQVGRELVGGFERAGFDVRGAFCVAADGWGDYLDRDHDPVGRPLSEIEERATALGLSHRPVDSLADLPTPDPDRAAAFARVYDELELEIETGEVSPLLALLDFHAATDLVSWSEHCITASRLGLAELAWLLRTLQSPAMRDVAVLHWAFGLEVGTKAYLGALQTASERRRTGESMDELIQRKLEAGVEMEDGDLMLGQTDRIPDRERMGRAVDILRDLLSIAPPHTTAAPGVMLAWLLWGLGRGSDAGAVLDRVLAEHPGYGMADVLNTVLASGMLPEWVFTRGNAERAALAG